MPMLVSLYGLKTSAGGVLLLEVAVDTAVVALDEPVVDRAVDRAEDAPLVDSPWCSCPLVAELVAVVVAPTGSPVLQLVASAAAASAAASIERLLIARQDSRCAAPRPSARVIGPARRCAMNERRPIRGHFAQEAE